VSANVPSFPIEFASLHIASIIHTSRVWARSELEFCHMYNRQTFVRCPNSGLRLKFYFFIKKSTFLIYLFGQRTIGLVHFSTLVLFSPFFCFHASKEISVLIVSFKIFFKYDWFSLIIKLTIRASRQCSPARSLWPLPM
jgi:hypothetical protein